MVKYCLAILGILFFNSNLVADEGSLSDPPAFLSNGGKLNVKAKGGLDIIPYSKFPEVKPQLSARMVERMRQATLENRENGYVVVAYDLRVLQIDELLKDNKKPKRSVSQIISQLSFSPKSFDKFDDADVVELKVVPAGQVSSVGSTGIKRILHHELLGNLLVYENDIVKSGVRITFPEEAINFYVGDDSSKPGILTEYRNNQGQIGTYLRWVSGNIYRSIRFNDNSKSSEFTLNKEEKIESLKKLSKWLSE